ncbi:MAG: ornithine uptake porin CarO [Acinetobacter populi]|uniref:ornithine uptake porin CarO n=1 Tax=Acinetobacter populi TaxID=1582270 RepID=UPI0023526A9D|nr:ornithine uptake porin CarO [Acinetobacter populi]MCH4248239.1 ornithine uptake porin CarO [Acinetobacter populi]
MKMLRVLAVAALASSATFAMADEQVITEEGIASFSTFKPASVRAEVGTTGYGGALSWSVNPYTAITAGYNGGDISWSDDIKVNGSTYDLDMDNKAAYLNAEIRPFANWFYVAAGVGYLDNDYDLNRSVRSGAEFQVNNEKFTAADGVEINGKLKYKEFAPYLGLGFSPAITNRWGVFGEVGAYYTGNPEVTLTPYGSADKYVNGQAIDYTTEYQDAVREEAKKIANDDKYKWLPVAKVGVSFRF